MLGIPVQGHLVSCRMFSHMNCHCTRWVYGRLFLVAIAGAAIEIASGWEATAFSLIADGAHMFSDALVFGLAFLGFLTAGFNPDQSRARMERYERRMRGLILMVGVMLIASSLVQLIWYRQVIGYSFDAKTALTVGVLGATVNIWMFLALRGLEQGQLEGKSWLHRGAMLHTIGDFGGSLAVIATTGGVLLYDWPVYLDRIAAFAIGAWLVSQALRGEHAHAHHGEYHHHHDREV